jgi:hypothetical protein
MSVKSIKNIGQNIEPKIDKTLNRDDIEKRRPKWSFMKVINNDKRANISLYLHFIVVL